MRSSKEVADFPLTRRSTSQRVDLPPGMLTVSTLTQEGVYRAEYLIKWTVINVAPPVEIERVWTGYLVIMFIILGEVYICSYLFEGCYDEQALWQMECYESCSNQWFGSHCTSYRYYRIYPIP